MILGDSYHGDLALKKDATLTELIDEAVCLNPYAATTRYPGFSDEIEESEVQIAISIAEIVFSEILSRLPLEVHP
ncbi:hypothetical protein WDW86_16795 [Bdellovibrionota bacterium FG-2]